MLHSDIQVASEGRKVAEQQAMEVATEASKLMAEKAALEKDRWPPLAYCLYIPIRKSGVGERQVTPLSLLFIYTH